MFKQANLSKISSALIILAFVLSGCASAVQAETPKTGDPGAASSHGNDIGGYVELVDALKGTGATVEPAAEMIESLFDDASAFMIKLNGSDVQVFEFPDEAGRKAASDSISPDGTSTGTKMITWIDQPNFWAKSRLIVLYVGTDPAMLSLLTSLLGDPITSHS